MENYLENRKVTIKIVEKLRTGFDKKSDGSTMYTGCKQSYQLPTNQYDRLIPILDDDAQRFFEERMGLQRGELSFNNRKEDSFWRTFKVTLDKRGKILDLMDQEENLCYRILKVCNPIANSKAEVNVLQHSFYMETEEEETTASSRSAERFEEASRLFDKISKSDKKMANVLRVLGRTVAPDANSKWLKSEIVKIIEQKAKVGSILNIDDFISAAKDPDMDNKIFLMDAMEIGEIKVEGSTYKLRSGDVIGYDFAQALSFVSNPKNQTTRLLIEDKIKNNK